MTHSSALDQAASENEFDSLTSSSKVRIEIGTLISLSSKKAKAYNFETRLFSGIVCQDFVMNFIQFCQYV